MKRVTTLWAAVFLSMSFIAPKDFVVEQKKYQRVREAINEKGKLIAEKLKENNIGTDELNILIIAYKAEAELDLYAKNKSEISYKKLSTYEICNSSGLPGPKRRLGDNQVPEGYYHIDRFNPLSNFYLSLGINYPNQSDRKKCNFKNPGGDIFIHGSCVTIGCIPVTNDKIKEIYLYAVRARQNRQLNIPVYIFPFKMTDRNFDIYKEEYKKNSSLISFWTNLKTGFDKFESNKSEVKYSIDEKGNYSYERNL